MYSFKAFFLRQIVILLLLTVPFCAYTSVTDSLIKDSLLSAYKNALDIDQKFDLYKTISNQYKKDKVLLSEVNQEMESLCQLERWEYLPVIHYNKGYQYSRAYEFDSAEHYYNKALEAFIVLDDSSYLSLVYSKLARLEAKRSNYAIGLVYQKKALKYAITNASTIDSTELAKLYGSLGILYKNNANYIDALNAYYKSLEIQEVKGLKRLVAKTYSNIGLLYNSQANYDKAEEMYKKGVANLDITNKKHMFTLAILYSNLGANCKDKGTFNEALNYHKQALEIKLDLEKNASVAVTYNNLGELFGQRKEFSKALDYAKKALQIKEDLNDKNGTIISLNIMADLYNQTGKHQQAINTLLKSIELSKSIGAQRQLADAYEEISKSYEGIYKHKKAMSYYKQYNAIEDSIVSVDRAKKLAELDAIYQLDKKEDEIRLQNARIEKQQTDIQSQRTFIIIAIVALVLAVLALLSFVQSNRVKRKSNALLEASNQEIKIANIELQSLNEEIQNKNENLNTLYKTLGEKNRDITSSINYAKKIQDGILPTNEQVKSLFPNSFIVYKPKDIVSGDFYWMEEMGGNKFFMAADCTGHGVPGAFMSLIGSSIFNQLVLEEKNTDTGIILTKARDLIIKRLKQSGKEGTQKDGMDAALCMYDNNKSKLYYSGANNPVYIVRPISNGALKVNNQEQTPNIEGQACNLYEVKADSQPIGYYTGDDYPFTTNVIDVVKGDMVVVSSDGFPDQFGGPKGKKYKYKPFKKLFQQYYEQDSLKIGRLLDDEFENWRGNEEQIDDICIIGVKF